MLLGVAGAQQGQLAQDGDDVLLHPAEHRVGLHQPVLHRGDLALGPGQLDLTVGQLLPQRRHPLQVGGAQLRQLGSMPGLEFGEGLLAPLQLRLAVGPLAFEEAEAVPHAAVFRPAHPLDESGADLPESAVHAIRAAGAIPHFHHLLPQQGDGEAGRQLGHGSGLLCLGGARRDHLQILGHLAEDVAAHQQGAQALHPLLQVGLDRKVFQERIELGRILDEHAHSRLVATRRHVAEEVANGRQDHDRQQDDVAPAPGGREHGMDHLRDGRRCRRCYRGTIGGDIGHRWLHAGRTSPRMGDGASAGA
jgi:hypothetical protein